MIGIIQTIVYLYIALFIVITLHEIGHVPRKIKFSLKYGIFPSAAAMQAKYRLGGLIVNVFLFLLVYYHQPENIVFQYVGLIAWAHFIIYSILGSVFPEPNEKLVNINTYIFDDVPNEYGLYFWVLAGLAFYYLQSYYVPIFQGVIS